MKRVLALLVAVLFVFSTMLCAVAVESPTGEPVYVIDTDVDEDGGGSVHSDTEVLHKGEDATIDAEPDEDHEFDRWEIIGKYEIIEGDLNSEHIVIRPLEDGVKIIAHFKTKGDSTTHGQTAKPDNKPDAPKTGEFDNVAVLVVVASLAGLAAIVYVSKKRTAKSK